MIFFFFNYIFLIFVDLYVSLSRFIFCYPDPDQRFLKWIRIRTRPNDTVPTGSGSETLISLVWNSIPFKEVQRRDSYYTHFHINAWRKNTQNKPYLEVSENAKVSHERVDGWVDDLAVRLHNASFTGQLPAKVHIVKDNKLILFKHMHGSVLWRNTNSKPQNIYIYVCVV